jgi:hypothetical protein
LGCWSLFDWHSFEPKLFQRDSSAGTVHTRHYINHGLILTKCRPSLVDGGNAIFAAKGQAVL